MSNRFLPRMAAGLGLLLLCTVIGQAGTLPEDRADALYHRYEGGGVEIDGPSVLVRKQFGQSISVSGNYYVDMVSSASIDVLTTASPYTEERRETGFGLDYLRGKTLMNFGYSRSEESDFSASTAHFSVSQDLFGDLSTVTLGYSQGSDEVRRRGDMEFAEPTERRSYRIGLSQILTRNFVSGITFETMSDEGFLNNPYRSVRFEDGSSAAGYAYEAELYPRTRTSNALAVRGRYYLPWRAAAHGEYRAFTDTWGIDAQTAQLGYTHPFGEQWTLDFQFRHYSQTAADFYSDLFPRAEAFNFRARDKELSEFASQTLRIAVSYDFARDGWKFLEKGSLNLSYDHFRFDYENFRDLTMPGPVGAEPLYGFDAGVLQLYISVWY